MKVYLDNAASTKLHPEALEAMIPFLSHQFGNPSSTHSFGRSSKAAIELVRKDIGKRFNVKPNEIYFCSSATEANNLALKCAIRDLNITRIITSEVEHKCVLNTAKYLATSKGVALEFVRTNKFGIIDLEHLAFLLQSNNQKTLVSIMHIQNELGSINDIEKIGKLCRQEDALFHSDAVQSIGHYHLDFEAANLDFVSASAHKFNGPLGVGFLFKRNGLALDSWLHGGGHERNLRSGTENVAGIIGMSKALELSYRDLVKNKKAIGEMKALLKNGLQTIFEDIQFNEDPKKSTYTILSVSFPSNAFQDTFQIELDLAGIAVSGGSACSSGAAIASSVLTQLKFDSNQITLRFSFSMFNTLEEIDYVLDFFKKRSQNSFVETENCVNPK
jgi:cysteine desulfurase